MKGLIGIRERTRDVLKAELAQAAFAVFAEKGFHEVTVDEVARAIGISRATFFRQLGSKEDAVILALESSRTDYAASLRSISGTDVSPWKLVREALEPAIRAAEADPRGQLARLAVIQSEPNLAARLASSRADRAAALGEALATWVGDRFAARVYAGAALAAYDAAWSAWAWDPTVGLRFRVDHAFELITGGPLGADRSVEQERVDDHTGGPVDRRRGSDQ